MMPLRWFPGLIGAGAFIALAATAAYLLTVPMPIVALVVAMQAVVVLILLAWGSLAMQTRGVMA